MTVEGIAPVADRTLGFMVPARNARGQLVRLDATLAAVLAAHDYPPPLARLLAEALVVTGLVGATLRAAEKPGQHGQVTLQAQAKGGPVELMVCDWRAGELRGYLAFDAAADVTDGMSLPALFGSGHLAITLDQSGGGERYQGIVPLEGDTIAGAVEGYFENSEQVPTLIRVGVSHDPARGPQAGGLIVQHLARAEIGGERLDAGEQHPDWEHVAALAATTTPEELIDPDLSAEALLWRLFHEEQVRITPGPRPTRGCRCSPAHIRDVLMRFPDSERAAMRSAAGVIEVDCKFCSKVFGIEA